MQLPPVFGSEFQQALDSLTYTVVFDVTQAAYDNWWFGLVGFVFIAIGAAAPGEIWHDVPLRR
jgi:hypothetical protein